MNTPKTAKHGLVTPVGFVTLTKIVRDHYPVVEGDDMTLGQMVDRQLEEAAMRGETVQSFEVEINEPSWEQFMRTVERGTFA